jgi:putative hydrolase of the HAD superfamily
MGIKFNKQSVVVFDLDDTLYKEIDFLKSAYRHIAGTFEPIIGKNIYLEMLGLHRKGFKVFEIIISKYRLETSVEELLLMYREHRPSIKLEPYALSFLKILKRKNVLLGLMTDGRSISQRNKLVALDITNFFSDIIVSEEFGSAKPNPLNYKYFANKYENGHSFYYIGDNPKKDFFVPNQIGWTTICLLNNGQNIHSQQNNLSIDYQAMHHIRSFKELMQCF